uniref:Uncharacterized protein n=1 Tax=Pyrodinium bahamense TaxID=73915 RepID=A0A7S0FBY3_9DINO
MGSFPSSKNSWQQAFFLTVNEGAEESKEGEQYMQVYPVFSIAVTRNHKQLAAATSDNKINLWCLATHDLLSVLVGHAETIWQLMYSPDDSLLTSASADGLVKLWEAGTGVLAMSLPRMHSNWVWSLAWSSDGERLATGGSDARILVWDAYAAVEARRKAEFYKDRAAQDPAWADTAAIEEADAVQRANPLRHWQAHDKSIHRLAFAPTESRMLVSVGAEGTVAVWDAEVGALDTRLCGHLGAVNCLAINPTISEVIATGGEDHTVRLWDLRDVDPASQAAKQSREKTIGLNLAHYTLKGHEGGVVAIDFTSDGRLLASGSKDCEVRIWIPDLQNPVLLKRFVAHEAFIRDLHFAVDQTLLYTCSTDGMIFAWGVPQKWRYKMAKKKGKQKYEG